MGNAKVAFFGMGPGGGGVLDISVGGEVRRGPSYPYPVKTDRIPIFDTLFKSTEVNIN